jgi:2-deoxy-D-gluconate 3-dehydrogenase
MSRLFDLERQSMIITGAAGLIGRQFVRTLYEAGASVVLADINTEEAIRVASEFDSERIMVYPVDITSRQATQDMACAVERRFGRIDGLINSAALDPKFDPQHAAQHSHRFVDYPLDLWNHSLEVDCTGTFLCCQAVIPAMIRQNRGAIINISSTYGMVAPDQRLYRKADEEEQTFFKPVSYAVTKSAVHGLTRYLAIYYADKGIRVNTLTLGGVFNNHAKDFVKRYADRTPMGRMAEAEEYGGAAIFLLSQASSYMTGANLVIDGGWTAW